MKKNLLIHKTLDSLWLSIIIFIITGCTTKPIKGYVSEAYITDEVIGQIDSSITYTSYKVRYLLNYFDKESEFYPKKGENEMSKVFIDSPDKYDKTNCSSIFLNLPLHITKENWIIKDENGEILKDESTKYIIERKIYQAGSEYNYKCYYYQREKGGFYLKVFKTNKKLIINQLYKDFQITCTAKWNVTFEYNQDGFLVMEKYETTNAHKEENSKSVYGYAIYTYQ